MIHEHNCTKAASLLCLALLSTGAIYSTTYGQDAPEPPRLGIRVEPAGRGRRVIAIESEAPIRAKLKVGDIILRGRASEEGLFFRMHLDNGLHDIRVALGDGQNVVLTVDRPVEGRPLRPFERMQIELAPSDLFGPLGAYAATEPVGEYAQSADTEFLSAGIEDQPVTVPVFYATDREFKSGEYTGKRGTDDNPIKFGICEVSIPPDHRIGEIESPKWYYLEFSEDPLEHVVLKSTIQLSEQAFFTAFSQRISQMQPDTSKAFVYVHGYNVAFTDAAKRTAQMHYDLNFPGVPCFYSWPSNASMSGYISDAGDIEWSVPNIQQFLLALESRDDVDEIYVIAHSMGNRGLVVALLKLASQGKGQKIKEIILAAPDIDSVIFQRDIAPKLTSGFRRTTLYASSNDNALNVSDSLADMRRAGQIVDGFPTVSPSARIDIIDASDIDTDLLGHSYYGDSDSLISDIFNIVHNHQPVTSRAKLRAVRWPQGTFYKFAR